MLVCIIIEQQRVGSWIGLRRDLKISMFSFSRNLNLKVLKFYQSGSCSLLGIIMTIRLRSIY